MLIRCVVISKCYIVCSFPYMISHLRSMLPSQTNHIDSAMIASAQHVGCVINILYLPAGLRLLTSY